MKRHLLSLSWMIINCFALPVVHSGQAKSFHPMPITIQVEPHRLQYTLSNDVFFKPRSAALTIQGQQLLQTLGSQVRQSFRGHAIHHIQIASYTDKAYRPNQDEQTLRMDRENHIGALLWAFGIPASQLQLQETHAPSRWVASNQTLSGRYFNRRTTVTIVFSESQV